MGEARRKGDFEERKSQAIKAGRVKAKAKGKGSSFPFEGFPFGLVSAILTSGRKGKYRGPI